ncbi:hypothetical protein MF1_10900 [Bartonella quintana]|nr:hypothetical protein MF1_10900 [Bartonella quintana]
MGEIAVSSIFVLLIKYAVEFILLRSRLYNARYFARPFPKSELSFISEALRVNIVMELYREGKVVTVSWKKTS